MSATGAVLAAAFLAIVLYLALMLSASADGRTVVPVQATATTEQSPPTAPYGALR